MHSDFIFTFLDQPTEAVLVGKQYILWILPSLYLYMQFEATRRFLLAQGLYDASLWTLCFTTVTHIICLYIFVLVLDYEIIGAAIASSITFTLNFVIINLYVVQNPNIILSDKFFLVDKEAFEQIKVFLKYGLPACIMLMMEWWGYDFLSVMAGWIGVDELAACVVMFQVYVMAFMNSLGITYASVNMIGAALGENRVNTARTYIKATILFGLFCTSLICLFLWVLRYQIMGLFTSDQEVIDLAMEAYPFYLLVLFADLMQGVQGGVIRAIGYQHLATVCQLISIWIIMLPSAYFVCFICGLGYSGIWMGAPLGSFALASSYACVNLFAPLEAEPQSHK